MKEKYLLELGGENTDLGKYEALELLKFEKYSPLGKLEVLDVHFLWKWTDGINEDLGDVGTGIGEISLGRSLVELIKLMDDVHVVHA